MAKPKVVTGLVTPPCLYCDKKNAKILHQDGTGTEEIFCSVACAVQFAVNVACAEHDFCPKHGWHEITELVNHCPQCVDAGDIPPCL